MTDSKEREKFKPTQEEFIGDGLSDLGNSDSSGDRTAKKHPDYENRSLEDLRHEARELGVSGFGAMKREQLINRLKRM